MELSQVQMNSQMETGGTGEPVSQQEAQVSQQQQQQNPEGQQLSAEMKGKMEDYTSLLMNLMHSPKTRDDVIGILGSSKDPYMTIPQAAMAINDAAANQIQQGGGKVDINTQFLASQYLVGDLMEIGNSYGLFKVTKDDFGPLYQDSLQMYIQRGLKDGTIDPIELQLTGEKIMNQNQRVGGQYLAQQNGIPHAPSQAQIMQQQQIVTRRETMAEVQKQQAGKAKQQQDQQARQALVMQQMGGSK